MENGIYCITPATKPWKLKLSKKNVVHISRRQLPIAPDYARTAYSMQGFNLRSCKIDLNLGGMDPVTGYVAATRFKRADDVIILQPFDIKIFQKGAPDQPQLLMRHLAGEDISDGLAALHKKIKEQTAAQQQQKKQRANQNRSETQKRNWEGMTAEERQRRAPKPQKQQRANENRSEKQKRSWEGMTTEERQRRAPKPQKQQRANENRSEKQKRSWEGMTTEERQRRAPNRQGSTETVACRTCGKHKSNNTHDGYAKSQWQRRKTPGAQLECKQCKTNVTCDQCGESKGQTAYTRHDWEHRRKAPITCTACVHLRV
jgi:flagellar biosynthesis GTPase FlhF